VRKLDRQASATSRRDFLSVSALGVLGLATGAARVEWGGEAQPDGLLLYVGTYTEDKRSEGIHLVRFDTRTGELRLVGSVDAGANPSFLTLHPNGRVLYAVNETEQHDGRPTGAVSAFAVDPATGALTRLNVQASGGGAPCYVSVDRSGRVVLVANYAGGNVALFPIQTDGSLSVAAHVVQHVGHGAGPDRQSSPHAHWIATDPSNRFAVAADLGIDQVVVYELDPEAASMRHVAGADAAMRPGAGPRHVAFHPTLPLAFVANELDSTVTTLGFDPESGRLSTLGTRLTLPLLWRGRNYPADIHVAPSGRTVYVSNRGHNSIAVLSVADEKGSLTLEHAVPTEGDWPRNFTLDPSGRWLLVANQRSGSIVVFARDDRTGRLTPTAHRLAVPSPVCLRFR